MTQIGRDYLEHLRQLAELYRTHENRDIRQMAQWVLATVEEKLK